MLDASSRPHLMVHSATPYNAEPPLDRLRASVVTPQADFYVRSHATSRSSMGPSTGSTSAAG